MKKILCAAAAATCLLAYGANAEVINDNSGAYMSPFTSDGVTAGWITKSMSVKSSGQIGAAAGSIAATKVLENIPFAGMFGEAAGKAVGRQIALQAIGGEDFLKSSSDQSFATLEEMAQHIKDNHADREDLPQVLAATYAIYPGLQPVYAATGRRIAYNNAVKAVAAPNGQGLVQDLYLVSATAAGPIQVVVEADEMQPLVMVTQKGKSRPVAVAQAAKGAKAVTVDCALPEAGEYTISVQPVPKMFGGAKAGPYSLTVTGPAATVASAGAQVLAAR